MKQSKIPKGFTSGFIICMSIFLIGFWLLDVDITLNMFGFILLFCLIIGGLFQIRGIFHQGHFPIISGIIFTIGGILLFYGSLEFTIPVGEANELFVKDIWWTLTLQQAGIFLLVSIIGIISARYGTKEAMSNQWFWGTKRK